MFTLARSEQIHLPPTRRKRSCVLAAHTKQNILGDVAEINANAAAIRAAVFTDLMPDDVRLVGKTPSLHHRDSIGQQCIWAPQVEMRCWRKNLRHRQSSDLVKLHRAVAREPLVLGRHFSGLVDELPGRIGENRREAALTDKPK